MNDGVDRLSYLLGGAIGGGLIAWIGAANAVQMWTLLAGMARLQKL